jgi:hypothetical protein
MDSTCPITHCRLVSDTLDAHLQHLLMHEGQTLANFKCCFISCLSTFKHVRNLRKHLLLFHPEDSSPAKKPKRSDCTGRQFDFQFKCPHLSCGHVCLEKLNDIRNHLYHHADEGEVVTCPFRGCDKTYFKRSGIKSHFERIHIRQTVSNLEQCLPSTKLAIPSPSASSSFCKESAIIEFPEVPEVSDPVREELGLENSSEEPNSSLLYNLGDFYNQLLHRSRVPYCTVDFMVNKYLSVYRQGEVKKSEHIISFLRNEGCPDEHIQKLLNEIQEKDEFLLAHDTSRENNLGSQYHRTKFIENCFPFVAPVTCVLNPDENADKHRSFQYMSIIETLRLFLANEGYKRQVNVSQHAPSEDMFQGITDGLFYKTNSFFSDNPDAIPILMYSDAACLVNPLNTGKAKAHKITGFYFTFTTIPVWNRSKVDPLQVAIYVLEVDLLRFGYSAVLKPLIDDLKKLEHGVSVEGYNIPVKAGLSLWIADNLGAHEVAGLSKCFSSGNICRTCVLTYDDLKKGRVHEFSTDEGACPMLDSKAYDDALLSGDGKFGVQKQCPLNVLSSFHCAGQCPPCSAHDILEGVAAYDLHAYIKILISEKKLFTIERLNLVLSGFDFTKYNKKDIPPPIVVKNKFKISMSAGQMRVFLRYIGMILDALKCDSFDPVVQQIILLTEVFAYAVSPRLHRLEIEEWDNAIQRYLDCTQDILGKTSLRPKHHFLAHYGYNYMYYGPLNNVSSLRYESKHRFAKDTVHKAKNFKNVTKLISVRHQRLQSHLFHTGLFPIDLEVIGDAMSVHDAINECDAEDQFNIDVLQLVQLLDSSASVCKALTFRSTLYEPGLLLVMSVERFSDLMTVGRIIKCFVIGNKPGFIVRVHEAVKTSKGYYKTFRKGSLRAIRWSDLLDYMPLTPLKSSSKITYALHHYISSFV